MIDDSEPARSDGSAPLPNQDVTCILAEGCQRIARQALRDMAGLRQRPHAAEADPAVQPASGLTSPAVQPKLASDEPAAQLEVLADICAETVQRMTGSSRVILLLDPVALEAAAPATPMAVACATADSASQDQARPPVMRFGPPDAELEAMARQALARASGADAGNVTGGGNVIGGGNVTGNNVTNIGADAATIVPLRRWDRTAGVLAVGSLDGAHSNSLMAALIALGDTFLDAWLALDRQNSLLASRQQAVAALDRMDRASANHTQFLGVLSHELRNPATALVMGLSLLDIVPPDSSQGLRAREIMRNQTMLLVHLLDELQDVTRLERNTLTLQREVVDLAHVAQGAILEVQEAFSDQDVRLQTHLPERPVRLYGDPARLADMIRHLLENALKASRAGGSVLMRIQPNPDEQTITVEVRDDGRGIAAKDLPLIFQPFAMADRQYDRIRSGLGIGLAIVKGVIELHGGRIQAFSDGPGMGARFVICLPLLSEPARPA